MTTCERCGKELPPDTAECPGCVDESATSGDKARRRSVVLFTGVLSILILVLAFATSFALYKKDMASAEMLNTNAAMGMPVDTSLSDQEVASFREEIFSVFIFFSLPLIPLWTFAGIKPAQIFVVVVSALMLSAALTVSPGGDYKGCVDCLNIMLLSIPVMAILCMAAAVRLLVELMDFVLGFFDGRYRWK